MLTEILAAMIESSTAYIVTTIDETPLMVTNDSVSTAPLSYKSPSTLRILLYAICVIGIVLNTGVLYAIIKTVNKQSIILRTSLSLLCSMAAADSISLAALLLMLNAKYIARKNRSAMNLICKLDLFLIHASSAYSLWCWLILSGVRYLAIYRPYVHMRLTREPFFAVVTVAVMCLIVEMWILFEVQFIPEMKSCGGSVPEEWARRLQITEIIWSYFLPLIIITVLDAKVLSRRSVWDSTSPSSQSSCMQSSRHSRFDSTYPTADAALNTADGTLNISELENVHRSSLQLPSGTIVIRNSKRKVRSRRQLLQRCLAITIFDLGLNLPNYLMRLWINLASEEQFASISGFAMVLIEDISQLLYFGQFALNAVYLVCIIYDLPRGKERSTAGRKTFLRYTVKSKTSTVSSS